MSAANLLPEQEPVYRVTPSTGVVHRVPCIRMPDSVIEWPEFEDERDRPCSHCLGADFVLPRPERRRPDWAMGLMRQGLAEMERRRAEQRSAL